jgi:hypothetical protein
MSPAFRSALREAAAFLFFVALAAVATRPLVCDLRGQTLVGPDPKKDMWTMHWITGHVLEPGRLFGGNIFHPDPNGVLYSDVSLGTAVLLVPFRLWIRDAVPLYNAGVLLALAFAGWSFHALTRELTGSRGAGLLAGTLAAFASHQLLHVYHLNLISTGWFAWLLLGLHRLVRRPSLGAVALTGLGFALTALSSGYYAVAATIVAVVFAGVHWRAFVRPRALGAAAAAALLAALLVAPYARAFLALREREGLRRAAVFSTSLAFSPGRDLTSRGYAYRAVLGSGGEQLFPGLLTLALAAVALVRRRPCAAYYATVSAVLLLVSLGPQIALGSRVVVLPYHWLFVIPPLDSMRHPYTFASVATFTLSVLAGLGWSALATSSRPWATPAAILAAAIETLGPGPGLQKVAPGIPAVYQVLETLPPGAVLQLPLHSEDVVLWAARHGRPVANGIGAFLPARIELLDQAVLDHWFKKAPEDVDASPPARILAEKFQIRYLILRTGRKPALRPLAAALERSRAFRLVGEAEGDLIFEFRKGDVPAEGRSP